MAQRPGSENVERDREILRLFREKRWPKAQIAREFLISRQRVDAILRLRG